MLPLILPDRPIYHNGALWAYVVSLLAHSLDESRAFWEKNRKQIVVPVVLLALTVYVWALIRGWEYAVNEVLLGAVVTVGVPVSVSVLLYLWGVAKAPWLLHRMCLAAAPSMQADEIERLRDDLRLLAVQIQRFVSERHAGWPSREQQHALFLEDIGIKEIAKLSPGEAAQMPRAPSVEDYLRTTSRLYDEQFAQRVSELRRMLLKRGIADKRLESYPATLSAIQAVGKRLSAIAKTGMR